MLIIRALRLLLPITGALAIQSRPPLRR